MRFDNPSIRKETGFDEPLEAVADAENETASVQKIMDGILDEGVSKDIGDIFA